MPLVIYFIAVLKHTFFPDEIIFSHVMRSRGICASETVVSPYSIQGGCMSIFICKMCGHVAFGSAPEKCPSCGAPKISFEQLVDEMVSHDLANARRAALLNQEEIH